MTKRNLRRVEARDRRTAAVHEAAHVVIAVRHGGTDVVASIERAGRGGVARPYYYGRCWYDGGPAIRAIVGVAGAVGEHVWSTRDDPDAQFLDWSMFADTLIDPASMSDTDWKATGCEPGEPTDALISDAEFVASLLRGPLREEWLMVARCLMTTGEYVGS